MKVLSASNLRKQVRDGDHAHVILDQVSVDVAAGERVALMGPSGSGKSTLLSILGALDPAFEGEVTIDGQTLAGLSDSALAKLRNRSLGFVFQSYNLLSHLTVVDNVLLPARFSGGSLDSDRALAVLAQVNMGDKLHRRPATLSGGERQRVAIARALYNQPKVVLCDEPTGNLDAQTGRDILSLFEILNAAGTALLIATHDAAIAEHADRVLNLSEGKVR